MSFENKNVGSRPGHMPGVAVVVLDLGLDIFGKYTVKCMPACSQRKHRSYMKSLNVIDSPAKVFVKVISEHWQLLCNGQPPRQWCNGWPQPEKSSNLRAVYVESLGVLDHLGPSWTHVRSIESRLCLWGSPDMFALDRLGACVLMASWIGCEMPGQRAGRAVRALVWVLRDFVVAMLKCSKVRVESHEICILLPAKCIWHSTGSLA